MSFGAPAFLWLLAALPAVVLLHFVRSRRRRRAVSALFLWRRAQQVAQRQRRFAPTWLLLAQLLFVTLAALALARPQLGGGSAPDRILVIDASASMAASEGGRTRLERAVAEAEAQLAGAGRVAVVRAGLDARVLAPLGAPRGEVRAALEGLLAGDRGADLERAIGVARAIEGGAQIHLFSDTPGPGGAGVVEHDVAGTGINVGISAFDLGLQQAYVGLVSNSTRPLEVPVEITREGEPIASGSVLVPAGGVGSITFPLSDIQGIYRAAIAPPGGDALPLDDVAFAGSRRLRVVVDAVIAPLVKAFQAVPGVEVGTGPAPTAVAADLYVLTRRSPEGLAPGTYLLMAPAAQAPVFHTVREWDRGSPLTRFVDLRDVVVGLDPERAPWAPGGGWQVLASTGDLEPVIRWREAEGVRVLQLAFHLSQTDLVLRPAFPALVANLVATVRSDPRLELGSVLPEGAQLDGRPWSYALRPGVYRVGDRTLLASLVSEAESRLPGPVAGAAEQSAEPAPLPQAPTSSAAVRSVALALVGLALLALLAEWLLWSGARPRARRPGGSAGGPRGG